LIGLLVRGVGLQFQFQFQFMASPFQGFDLISIWLDPVTGDQQNPAIEVKRRWFGVYYMRGSP